MSRARPGTHLCQSLRFEFPNWLIYAYVALSVALYVFVIAHTPLAIQPDGGHDDEFYMSKGRFLAQGYWLGPYSQFTLMKGPGYPAFLAVANWTGLPVSWVHALFWAMSVVVFIVVAHRFIRSEILSGVFFTFLLWHPYSLMLLRVLREQIYPAQVLLIIAAGSATLYLAHNLRPRVILAALSGLLLGWFWLTREESVWILPGLAVLVAPAIWSAFRNGKMRELLAAIFVAVVAFAATQIGFAAANWHIYGKFIGVDFKEKNFQAAVRALNSVRSGGVKEFIGVTRAARERIYAVSPHFATLRDYLEGAPSNGWRYRTCTSKNPRCGEIGPGGFIWALRDAVASKGHYSSPSKASGFYGSVSREIKAACASGQLECEPRLIAEIPPFTWAQLLQAIPPRIVSAIDLLANVERDDTLESSTGLRDALALDVKFLNYPVHTPSSRMPDETVIYSVNGTYRSLGSDWFSVEAQDAKGVPVDLLVNREASSTSSKGANEEGQRRARFRIDTTCDEGCVLSFRTSGDDETRVSLESKQATPLSLKMARGEIVIESIGRRPNPALEPLKSQTRALRIRAFVMMNYRYAFFPLLILGAAAFLVASALYWRTVLKNVCYIIAAACWIAVISRAGLLILIDATSMQTLQWLYLSAAYALLVSAVMFSIASFVQLTCQTPRDA